MSNQHPNTARPGVQKVLWALYTVCAVLLIIDLVMWFTKFDKHPYLKWETWPGFYAAFGFIACVLLMLIARFILRPITKQREDFYLNKKQKEDHDA